MDLENALRIEAKRTKKVAQSTISKLEQLIKNTK